MSDQSHVGERSAGGSRTPVWLLVVLLLFGCSEGSDPGSFAAGDTDFAGALAQLPVFTGRAHITYVDYDRVAELVGGAVSSDQLIELKAATSVDEGGLGIRIPVSTLFDEQIGDDLEFGFALSDISALVISETGQVGDTFVAIVGPSDWGGAVLPLEGTDLRTYGTGDDGQISIIDATPARQVGSPLRVGTRDGVLGASISTDLTSGWVEGSTEVYSDIAVYRNIASQLGTAFVVHQLEGMATATDRATISEPFESVAIGSSVVDGRVRETVVYRFGSSDAAKRAKDSVGSVWAESTVKDGEPIATYVSVLDTRQVDELVVIETEIESGQVGIGLELFLRGDPPAQHQ